MEKSSDALRTISEVATSLDVPKHVLRFWESKFSQISPMKRGGGRRYYRPSDIELLKGIRHLLYGEGFTIRGVQQIFKREGVDYVKSYAVADSVSPDADDSVASLVKSPRRGAKKRPAAKDVDDHHKIFLTLLDQIDDCRKLAGVA